ncbi:hypothetical protein [Serratia sp. M24T3]|uniref:hypothetical protein n=1 Tax=Serratia sp. M24T3 TaxID=932213 RepID=UPI00025B9061|nr:hypothetical protein [Serratia sp. M24T3]EIC85430.1 hypothetical protein SPM24T3_06193 [Serratia sp. M24T3]
MNTAPSDYLPAFPNQYFPAFSSEHSTLIDWWLEPSAIAGAFNVIKHLALIRAIKITVRRERLELEQYRTIKLAANQLPQWFKND